MARVLILFAHPRLEKSRTNKALLRHIPTHDDITFHDLYEHYPDFNIDLEAEKKLLTDHDVIIWHHPFYWYNAPPLMKQWIDIVLELKWAYGPGGTALAGKICFNVLTTGGASEAYQAEGRNRYTIRQFMAPFEQTALLCKMIYLPPFVVQGTHKLSDEILEEKAKEFGILLNKFLFDDFDIESMKTSFFLNEFAKPVNL